MEIFNGVQLIIPDFVSIQKAGYVCVLGLGSDSPSKNEYFSSLFPHNLIDPTIPIHLKEFICVIIATKFWGQDWAGKKVQIFCDNDAVCDVVNNMKPKDNNMQAYLREFLYWVCKFNFYPMISKINTKENDIADFLS